LDSLPIFYLYSTLGCHLCEDARSVVEDLHSQMSERFGANDPERKDVFFQLRVVDIADDDRLVELYGARIPVLFNEGLSEALFWPFDVQSLYQFMSSVGKQR